ncbi:MAG: glutathione S-transferase family protein [Mangrovicoccus sp.]
MTKLTLFHAPGACSTGIKLLLEEAGAAYDQVTLNLAQGEQRGEAYQAKNPKGKVPALTLPDGKTLTEFPVIAYWIARHFPEARLLPEGFEQEIQVLELTEYIVSSLHMRGSVFVMRPEKFAADPAAQEELRQHGRQILAEGYALIADHLAGADYLCGAFSIADAAAFYLLSWRARTGVDFPAPLDAYYQRLTARPAAARLL